MFRIRGSGNKDTQLKRIVMFRRHGVTGWPRKTPVLGPAVSGHARDRLGLVTRPLRAKGWRMLRIWDHELARHNPRRLRFIQK